MERRVVITGIGPVTSIGIGKEEFFESMMGLKSEIRRIPEEYEKKYPFKSVYYVPAPEISLSRFGLPASVENAMERAAKFCVVGAKLALMDAGLNIVDSNKYFAVEGVKTCDVVIGIGMSSIQTALTSYVSHVFEGDRETIEKFGLTARFNRMVIPMLMPDSASSWISILYGFKGANYTMNASCASGTCAIGEAYMRIKNGLSNAAVTGGVECLAEKYGGVMRGFDMLSTLTKSEDGNPMPFSNRRSGFLFNEGAACILLLEELESALKRGADIYAEISGYECNSDAFNIVQMDETGEQIKKLLVKIKGSTTIDYINAHGTGTVLNDDIEAKIIRDVFGDKCDQPLINSSKGILGHSIGASGALEAAITAMSIKKARVHGSRIDKPMENLNIVMESKSAKLDYALSTSYGFGGHNAAILFKRYGEQNG